MNTVTVRRTELSLAEAAAYVGVSYRTIRRWISDGKLPARRLGPRMLRVRIADLDEMSKVIVTVGTIENAGRNAYTVGPPVGAR